MSTSAILADRRPTYLIDTPCLTRHYVIRFGELIDPIAEKGKRLKVAESWAAVLSQVNAYIEIMDAYRAVPAVPGEDVPPIPRFYLDPSLPEKLGIDPYPKEVWRWQTSFAILELSGVRVDMMIDVHTEYLTVQFRAYPFSADLKSSSTPEVVKSVALLAEAISKGDTRLVDTESEHVCDADRDRMIEEVYEGFWAELLRYDESMPPRREAAPEELKRTGGRWVRNGLSPHVFFHYQEASDLEGLTDADGQPIPLLKIAPKDNPGLGLHQPLFRTLGVFKGFILRNAAILPHDTVSRAFCEHQEHEEHQDASLKRLGEDDKTLVENNFAKHSGLVGQTPQQQLDGYTNKAIPKRYLEALAEDRTADDINRAEFHRNQIQFCNFSKLFTRILGYRRGETKREDHVAGNTVLCGLLSGLAIYGSRFGRELEPPNAPEAEQIETSEARYFLFYSGPSRNQLARLVRRLHYCGENRIMSLIDFTDVRRAGDRLRGIDTKLDVALRLGNVKGSEIKELQQQIAEAALSPRGGLAHRVGRTRYYHRSLENRIRDLRVERIFGWQTYDEFISRSLVPQLQTFSRLGDRLQDVEARHGAAEEIVETQRQGSLNVLVLFLTVASTIAASAQIADFFGDALNLSNIKELGIFFWMSGLLFATLLGWQARRQLIERADREERRARREEQRRARKAGRRRNGSH